MAYSISPTVLLVADDAVLVDYLADSLETAGCRVLAADDGHAAIRSVARSRPSLVVADASLPRLDRFALAARLREWEVPVILLGPPLDDVPLRDVISIAWPLDVSVLLDIVVHATEPGTA